MAGVMPKEETIVPAKRWETYEEVAAYLLHQFAEHFGVGRFEGKQVVPGESGTEWQIDAKGCNANGTDFIVVECKRHTKTGISQAIAGALAWQIQDTGAMGGVLVSPLGLQEGAKKVAASAGIAEVLLDHSSTTSDYLMSFLNRVHAGSSDTANLVVSESVSITIADEDGNVIETKSFSA